MAPTEAAGAPPAPARSPGSRAVALGLAVMLLFAPLSISGTQLGLAVAILGALWDLARGRRGPPGTPFDRPILLLVAVTLVSALASAYPAASLERSLTMWTTLTLYLVAGWLEEPGRLSRFLALLAVPAVLAGAYGVLQFFTGWHAAGSGPLDTLSLPGQTLFMPRGGFSHYQTFANVFLVLFCLMLALALGSGRGPLRTRQAAVALFLGAVLVLSFTRGVWVAALVALALFVLAFSRRPLRHAAGMAALVAVLLLASTPLRLRVLSMASLETNVERLLMWETGWNMLRDHPLLGIGLGNYRAVQAGYLRDEVPMPLTATHTHNIWLQVALERGALGFIAFLWLVVTVARVGAATLRRLRPAGGMPYALAAGALAALAGLLVDGFVQNNFGDSQVATLFWLTLGVLAVCERVARSGPGPAAGGAERAAGGPRA